MILIAICVTKQPIAASKACSGQSTKTDVHALPTNCCAGRPPWYFGVLRPFHRVGALSPKCCRISNVSARTQRCGWVRWLPWYWCILGGGRCWSPCTRSCPLSPICSAIWWQLVRHASRCFGLLLDQIRAFTSGLINGCFVSPVEASSFETVIVFQKPKNVMEKSEWLCSQRS